MLRLIAMSALIASGADLPYEAQVAKWRQDRENALKAPDGWLSVAGLFWLKPGRNDAGSSAAAGIVLPSRAPAQAGTFTLAGDKVSFEAAQSAAVTINGKPMTSATLQDDREGKPDIVEVAGLKLFVLHRGGRYAVRMKDNESEYRKNFQGLRWFPVRRDWLITARFVTYPRVRNMKFDSQTGDPQDFVSPGYVEFERAGQKYRLTPVLEDGRLFFVFRDRTAGKTTYPAARFLYAEMPGNDRVTLDFNKAYNPPCVFIPYATCPLPPPENRLRVEVNAGELMYGGKH
jgi:uncharacterized protein (DUF1684 family)